MRLELIPVLLGILVGLFGVGLIYDALAPDRAAFASERRRRERAERNRIGEAAVGVGTLCMAAALVGRDVWRFGTVAVIASTVLLLTGALLNRRYLKEILTFRGPARRSRPGPMEPRGFSLSRAQGGRSSRRAARTPRS